MADDKTIALSPQQGTTRRPPLPLVVALTVLVVFLAVCYVTPFLLAPIEVDFGRDLNFGYRIASGQEWVAIGPRIGTGWHVGPVWYYLLALPMLLGKSLTATVMFVGILALLQFPLAFQTGRQMLGSPFGVAWAILLALPGMSTLESIWVAHPSLVATASTAVVYALWNAWERRSWSWLYFGSVVFGLALHAHPTALPLAVLFAPVVWRLRGHSSTAWFARLAGCALLVLLPFAPLLLDAQAQARNLFAFSHDVASASLAWRERSVLVVVANVFWNIPNLIVSTFVGEGTAVLAVWKTLLVVLYALTSSGIVVALLRPALGLRTLAGVALAYLVFSGFVVLAVRAETRFYMIYALLPIVAFLQAVGLTAWTRSGAIGMRRLVDLALAAILISFSVVAIARVNETRAGYVRLPDMFDAKMDIGVVQDRKFVRLDSLPMWALDAIGHVLCDAGDVHAYGDLAVVIDSQYNVPARLYCGERSAVTLGGAPGSGQTALYLLPAADVGAGPASTSYGGLRLGAVESIPYPGRGIPIVDGGDYATRPGCMTTRTHAVDFVALAGSTVVIAPSLPVHCPIRIVRLAVGGLDITPTAAAIPYVVRAPPGAASAEWHLDVDTGDIGALQVFTIAGGTR